MDFPLRTICTLIFGLFVTAAVARPLPQLTQPDWSELNPEQRRVLVPLAAEWGSMETFRRKKWIGIADRFASMSSEEQARIQQRMREWAKLRPEERKLVREKFKALKKVESEQRQNVKQQWKEYQALSQEERERLREKARQRPIPPKTSTVPPNTQSATGGHQSLVRLPTPSGISPFSPIKPPQSTMVPKAGMASKKE